jgi:hypothetical protein
MNYESISATKSYSTSDYQPSTLPKDRFAYLKSHNFLECRHSLVPPPVRSSVRDYVFAGSQDRPLDENDDSGEEVPVVFDGGGQVAADRRTFGSSEAARVTGHLLTQLDHADVAFGSVVILRYAPVRVPQAVTAPA